MCMNDLREYMILIAAFFSIQSVAQNTIRIHYKNGSTCDFPICEVDSITFSEGNVEEQEPKLLGAWLWGDVKAGYYELLTFNDDKTYMGYDNYFTYGFDTMTYGWYMQMGSMLTLQSNGFGYNRHYNWFILGLTDNALDVMTKMGQYTYYRLQPEILHLQAGGEPLACKNGDYFLFADNVVTSIVDGGLQGRTTGTTYVQKYIAKTSQIVAYKVVVE